VATTRSRACRCRRRAACEVTERIHDDDDDDTTTTTAAAAAAAAAAVTAAAVRHYASRRETRLISAALSVLFPLVLRRAMPRRIVRAATEGWKIARQGELRSRFFIFKARADSDRVPFT